MTLPVALATGAAGGIGALLRLLLEGAVTRRLPTPFPAGILLVNLTGSFLLGLLVGAGVDGDAARLLEVGLIGGFTTFSAWMLDTSSLARRQMTRLAASNLAVGLVLGAGGVALGRVLGRIL